MNGATPTFWSLVVITVVICAIPIAHALLKPRAILVFPFLACLVWAYLYESMAVSVGLDSDYLLPSWALEFGQFVAIASLVGLLAGWYSTGKSVRRVDALESLELSPRSARRVFVSGVILLAISLIGQYTFYGQEVIDYQTTSNYWYLMFYAGYPGIGLCIVALMKGRLSVPLLRWALLLMLGLILLAPHVIMARRGPLFPAIVIIVYLPYLIRGTAPSRLIVSTGLIGAGLLMMLFVAVRQYSYAPDGVTEWTIADRIQGWERALQDLNIQTVFIKKQKSTTDNEFLYHCGAVATIWELSDYQYGSGYLTLLLHWIPRQWWKGKPMLQGGIFESHWIEGMNASVGWTLSGGAATGGVANVFEQFGLFSPVFWYLLGSLARKLFRRNESLRDHEAALQYTGLLCTSHWLLTQGFGAMFVPACYYIVLPTVVLRLCIRGRPARPRLIDHITIPEVAVSPK